MTHQMTHQSPAESGGERAAVQTLREVWLRLANATASGLRWLQHRFSRRVIRGSHLVMLLASACSSLAQSTNDVPPLLPALPEIPPTLWEQHGILIMVLGIVGLVLLVAMVWWLLQPKPHVPVPIEIQTRQQLEQLKQAPEDGKTISQISQVLKRYVTGAFELSTSEMTTTEFSQTIAGSDKIGNELAVRIGDFLRACDEQKFSPVTQTQTAACSRAWELFQAGETRRAELRQIAKPR